MVYFSWGLMENINCCSLTECELWIPRWKSQTCTCERAQGNWWQAHQCVRRLWLSWPNPWSAWYEACTWCLPGRTPSVSTCAGSCRPCMLGLRTWRSSSSSSQTHNIQVKGKRWYLLTKPWPLVWHQQVLLQKMREVSSFNWTISYNIKLPKILVFISC